MSSSQRPSENSVLFSLRELRQNRGRSGQEGAGGRPRQGRGGAPGQERRRTALPARQKSVGFVTRRSARVSRREADEQRDREGSLRLQEAERRARVEGEMRINEERMRLEMQHKKKHSPVKAVAVGRRGDRADRRRRRIQDVLRAPDRADGGARGEGPRRAGGQEGAGRARGELGDDREGLAREAQEGEVAGGYRSDSEGAHADATGRAGWQAQCARTPRQRPTMPRRRRSCPTIKGSATFRTIRTLGL